LISLNLSSFFISSGYQRNFGESDVTKPDRRKDEAVVMLLAWTVEDIGWAELKYEYRSYGVPL
jgi:hypothetical protein